MTKQTLKELVLFLMTGAGGKFVNTTKNQRDWGERAKQNDQSENGRLFTGQVRVLGADAHAEIERICSFKG